MIFFSGVTSMYTEKRGSRDNEKQTEVLGQRASTSGTPHERRTSEVLSIDRQSIYNIGGKHMNRIRNVLKKHFMSSIFIGMLAILLLRTGGTTTLALALTCGQWNVIPSPNGPSGSDLNAVAVISPNDVWAVGYNPPGGSFTTLIAHWDGTQWSVVPSPSPGAKYNTLYGAAAVSPNIGGAGGYFCSGGNHRQTLIAHWYGYSWSIVASP